MVFCRIKKFMDNRILNTITQYDTLILSMKLYYSHTTIAKLYKISLVSSFYGNSLFLSGYLLAIVYWIYLAMINFFDC